MVDLLVLFILHSTNANHSRRGAERVLKVKVRKGLIQESLLQKTFKGHAQVCFHLRDYEWRKSPKYDTWCFGSSFQVWCNCFIQVMRGYFPSILALAQGLLRSSDCCVVPFGGHMYKQSFTAFDSYCRQVQLTHCRFMDTNIHSETCTDVQYMCVCCVGGGGLSGHTRMQWCEWWGRCSSWAALWAGIAETCRDEPVHSFCEGMNACPVCDLSPFLLSVYYRIATFMPPMEVFVKLCFSSMEKLWKLLIVKF